MRVRLWCSIGVVLFAASFLKAQQVLTKTLLRADKQYIHKKYHLAVKEYVRYLQDYPKDYYASRQAARCYDRLNDHYNAIDFWPLVVESSDASDEDFLDYAKCLLANDRMPEAKKIFNHLSRSQKPAVAAWGKAYLQPAFALSDTTSVKVTELVNVNSPLSEACPIMFRDKLFFVLNSKPGLIQYKAMDHQASETLKVFIPKDSTHFLPSLLFEKLQQMNIRGQVSFSPDGNWMYFCKTLSNKELGVKSKVTFFKHQIFVLKLSTLNLPFPEITEFEHNIPEYNTMHPSISEDGRYLYFSSDRKGSAGGMDLFVCTRKNSTWSEPLNLGPNINTNGNEVFPFISADSVLYFSSDQRPGLGGLDVFVARSFSTAGNFAEAARNAGDPINSRFDDFGVYVFKGGKKGYLSSKRKNNSDEDLYYFSSK